MTKASGTGGQMTRRHKIAAALVLMALAAWALAPRPLAAHPMGNFSVSHYAGLRIGAGGIELRYILDMAEIPTFQEMQAAGIASKPDDPGVAVYLAKKAEALRGGLALTLNGRPLALSVASANVIFPPGAGNLPTMKIGVVYRAPLPDAACPCRLEYRDGNLPERAGWKEVVAAAEPGATLVMSSAAAVSRSQELANYPTDLVNGPPQELAARVTFDFTKPLAAGGPTRPASTGSAASRNIPKNDRSVQAGAAGALKSPTGERGALTEHTPDIQPRAGQAGRASEGPALAPPNVVPTPAAAPPARLTLAANHQGTPHNAFTELIASNQWGLWFMLTAALIAAALGGLHALEPGHGKTIVAAYLVGSQGTAAHAVLLGLIVTVTHTAGVYSLGLVTLYLSNYIVPDQLYPWLGIASGLTIAFLGLYMLRHRLAGHSHGHGHHHHHGPFGHSHVHPHSHGPEPSQHLHAPAAVENSHSPAHGHGDAHSHEHSDDHAMAGHSHTHDHGHSHDHSHDHAAAGHDHSHDHDHAHGDDHSDHHDHAHDAGHSHGAENPFSYRQLVTLGITGGIVPCPAALVVLLSAISLHRIAFGLYLIVAFSLGLAAVLISIGMITVYARRLLSRVPSDGPLINRWLPTASAAVITCLGVGIAVQAVISMGVVHVKL